MEPSQRVSEKRGGWWTAWDSENLGASGMSNLLILRCGRSEEKGKGGKPGGHRGTQPPRCRWLPGHFRDSPQLRLLS